MPHNIEYFSMLPTELGLAGKWGCRCPSKCSVGTAVGIKISSQWWLEKINFMWKKSYFGMFYNISWVSKLSYLVPLALRNVSSGRYGTRRTSFVLSCSASYSGKGRGANHLHFILMKLISLWSLKNVQKNVQTKKKLHSWNENWFSKQKKLS